MTATAIFVLMALPIVLYVLVNAERWDSIVTPVVSIPRLPSVQIRSDHRRKGLGARGPTCDVENLRLGRLLVTQNDGLIWNEMPRFGLLYLFVCRWPRWDRADLPCLLAAWLLVRNTSCWRGASRPCCSRRWFADANRLNVGLFPLVYCTTRGLLFLSLRVRWAFYAAAALYAVIRGLYLGVLHDVSGGSRTEVRRLLVEAIAAAGRDPTAPCA